MKLQYPKTRNGERCENASVLVIVLWICIGLVSIALYFSNSMTFELRAADNRVNGTAADQAIEGAARYVGYALENYATNGAVPDNTQFKCEAVSIGDAKFWLIGRNPDPDNTTEPYFGLVDEASKINLNTANTNVISYLPNMTLDFASAIADWRSTNGGMSLDYTSLGYLPKYAAFESVDELRLVYGADVSMLAGDDINRNGVLDANEKDTTGSGQLNSGLFEYATVYTREPNFHSDGTTLTNVSTATAAQLTALLRNDGAASPDQHAAAIYAYTHPNQNTTRSFRGLFDFAVVARQTANISLDDFTKIVDDVTTTNLTYLRGRINVNTASADVLTALFEGLNNGDQSTAEGAAQTLVTYRQQNPGNLSSVAWVYDALGSGNTIVTALRGGDYITTHSFQFTADIAAVGPFGRGYRRVKFIFDVSDGAPKILYRQDLSRLGWALGDKARQNLLANNTQ